MGWVGGEGIWVVAVGVVAVAVAVSIGPLRAVGGEGIGHVAAGVVAVAVAVHVRPLRAVGWESVHVIVVAVTIGVFLGKRTSVLVNRRPSRRVRALVSFVGDAVVVVVLHEHEAVLVTDELDRDVGKQVDVDTVRARGVGRRVGERGHAHVLRRGGEGGHGRGGEVGPAGIGHTVLILVAITDDQIQPLCLNVVGAGRRTGRVGSDHQAGELWNEVVKVQARHVVVIAQVHRRAVRSKVGEEKVVVHGGGSRPVDLVGHRRCRWRQRPHVLVNQCVGNGCVHIIRDGEVALPFVVVDDNPGNIVSGSD